MDLVSAACFPSLSPEEKRQQMYLALYNWAADDSLLDPLCFPGSSPTQQEQAILSALSVQGGDINPTCVGDMTATQRSQAMYAALYAVAGDDELTEPGCFYSLSPIQQGQAIYVAIYTIAGDDTLLDPNCFYGSAPWQQEQALFAGVVAASTAVPPEPPSITSEPSADNNPVDYGNPATISVTATGGGLSYQWYEGESGDTSSPIEGATSRTYETPGLTETTSYWVRITNTLGSVDGDTVTVSVTPAEAPAITDQPDSSTIEEGDTANLSVTATGTPTLTYQWYQGASGVTTSPISGATATSYTTPALTSTTSYWVRVTGPGGAMDSNAATITVTPALIPDAQTQLTRISTDGGYSDSNVVLSNFIAALKNGGAAGDCYALLTALYLPGYCKKDGANKVSKLYDLAPQKGTSFGTNGYYDVVQNTAASQQTFTASGLDGMPVLTCVPTAGGYALSGSVNAKTAPLYAFGVFRKNNTTSGVNRAVLNCRASPTGSGTIAFFFTAETGQRISAYGGGSFEMQANTAVTTWGLYSMRLDGASGNYHRRNRANLGLISGTNVNGFNGINVACLESGGAAHDGPIACLAFAGGIGLTTAQRDHIENTIHSFFPSNV